MFLEIIRVSILQLILALKKMDGFLKVRLASFNTCQSLRGHCLIKSFEIFQHRAKELVFFLLQTLMRRSATRNGFVSVDCLRVFLRPVTL